MKINDIIQKMGTNNCPSQFWLKNNFCKEIEQLKLIYQKNNQSIHQHTMQVLDNLLIKNPVTLFSALFHDTGKFYTKKIINNKISFAGHELISAEVAKKNLKQWGAEETLINDVSKLILTHMIDIKQKFNKGKLKKFIAFIGPNNLDNWLSLRRADARSYRNYGSLLLIDIFEKTLKQHIHIMSNKNLKNKLECNGSINITGE